MSLNKNQRATGLLSALGIVADVSAVVSLAHSQLQFIVTVGGSVALLIGIYLFIRRWGQPINLLTAMYVAMMLAGTFGITTSVFRSNEAGIDPLKGLVSEPIIPPFKAPQPPRKPVQIVYDGSNSLQLTPGDGIDFERGGDIIPRLQGPTGPIDLHLAPYKLSGSVNNDRLYPVISTRDATYADCAKLVAEKTGGINLIVHDSSLQVGEQYCFQTAEGHTGWFRITERRLTNSAEGDHLNLVALVWNQ